MSSFLLRRTLRLPFSSSLLCRNRHSFLYSSVASSPSVPLIRRANLQNVAKPSPFSLSLRFASSKVEADESLKRVLEYEIDCAKQSVASEVEEIPKGFPFDIKDEKGMNTITLKRKYQDENIEVVVSMPSLVSGEEPDNNREDDEEEEADRNEKPSQSSIPLTVTVSKGEGLGLEFSCTAYPDEVMIDSMSVIRENKQSDEEMIAYEGPDFNDLDENLQKAFHKYLELRGITPITTNFLQEYMINKDSREYMRWLKNLKQFVEK